MPTSLSIVRRYFPDVEKVVDGTRKITVHITPADSKRSTMRDHSACALAKAAMEQERADGAIVSINTAYIIAGSKATRYRLPESTAREIVSFDRAAGFEPGDYQLNPPQRKSDSRKGDRHRKPRKAVFRHVTTNIRTSLNHGGGE